MRNSAAVCDAVVFGTSMRIGTRCAVMVIDSISWSVAPCASTAGRAASEIIAATMARAESDRRLAVGEKRCIFESRRTWRGSRLVRHVLPHVPVGLLDFVVLEHEHRAAVVLAVVSRVVFDVIVRDSDTWIVHAHDEVIAFAGLHREHKPDPSPATSRVL